MARKPKERWLPSLRIDPIEDKELHKHRNKELGRELQKMRGEMFVMVSALLNNGNVQISDKMQKRIDEEKAFSHEVEELVVPLAESDEKISLDAIIARIQELRDALVKRNLPLMLSGLKEHKMLARQLPEEERVDAGFDALMRAAEKWQPKKSEFSTTVYNYVKWRLLKAIEKREKPLRSLDANFGREDEELSLIHQTADSKAKYSDEGMMHESHREQLCKLIQALPHVAYRRSIELVIGMHGAPLLTWEEVSDQMIREGVPLPKGQKKMNKRKAEALYNRGIHLLKKRAREKGDLEKEGE